jgi:hypothetical protein
MKLTLSHWDRIVPDEVYPMELVPIDWKIVIVVLYASVIDLNPYVSFRHSDGPHHKVSVEIADRESLRNFLIRLIRYEEEESTEEQWFNEDGEYGEHTPMGLASSILYTLDIEWV